MWMTLINILINGDFCYCCCDNTHLSCETYLRAEKSLKPMHRPDRTNSQLGSSIVSTSRYLGKKPQKSSLVKSRLLWDVKKARRFL